MRFVSKPAIVIKEQYDFTLSRAKPEVPSSIDTERSHAQALNLQTQTSEDIDLLAKTLVLKIRNDQNFEGVSWQVLLQNRRYCGRELNKPLMGRDHDAEFKSGHKCKLARSPLSCQNEPNCNMRRHKIELYFSVLLVGLAAVAAALSLTTYISDSEFWAITLAKKLGEGEPNASLAMKFIFYGLLKPLYWLPLDNVSHVLFARLEFAAIGCLTAWIFYLVARLVFSDTLGALILTLVLTTSSFFISQSFRVRSDNLASLIALIVFALTLKASRSGSSRWIRDFSVIALLNLALLAVTPKSFYFLITGATFDSLLPFQGLSRTRQILGVSIGFLLPPFLVITPLALLSRFELAHTLQAAAQSGAQSAFEYFIDSFHSSSANGSYLSATDFRHVLRFLRQNPIHDGFFIFAAFAWIKNSKNGSKTFLERRAFLALFSCVGLLLVFHNQKLPFFIYSLLPFLVLSSGVALHDVYLRFLKSARFNTIIATAATICVLSALYVAQTAVADNSNQAQVDQLRFLQSFLKEENVSFYYDGIGLLPRMNSIYSFPSPGDRHNAEILTFVKSLKPPLILYVNRLQNLEPLLTYELMNNYYDIGGGIWARAVKVESISSYRKDGDGRCHVSKSALEEAINNNWRVRPTAITPSGLTTDGHLIHIPMSTSNDSIDFQCGDNRVWFSALKPISTGVPIDFKYLFAFDLMY